MQWQLVMWNAKQPVRVSNVINNLLQLNTGGMETRKKSGAHGSMKNVMAHGANLVSVWKEE